MTTTNITISTDTTTPYPLYHVYPRQHRPQNAYLEIHPATRTAYWEWNAEIGNAIPMTVYHRRAYRVRCDPALSRSQLARLSSNATVVQLLSAICDGYSEEWDGSNTVGRLTDAAQDALEQLEQFLDTEEPDVTEWDDDGTPIS